MNLHKNSYEVSLTIFKENSGSTLVWRSPKLYLFTSACGEIILTILCCWMSFPRILAKDPSTRHRKCSSDVILCFDLGLATNKSNWQFDDFEVWIFRSGWTSLPDHIAYPGGSSVCFQHMNPPTRGSHACHFPHHQSPSFMSLLSFFFFCPFLPLPNLHVQDEEEEGGEASHLSTPPAHLPHIYIPKAQPGSSWLVILLTYDLPNFWGDPSLSENGEMDTTLHQWLSTLVGSSHAPYLSNCLKHLESSVPTWENGAHAPCSCWRLL